MLLLLFGKCFLGGPLPSPPQCWARGGENSYHYPIYSFHPTTITGGLAACYTNLLLRLKLKNSSHTIVRMGLFSYLSKGAQPQTNLFKALPPAMLTAVTQQKVDSCPCWWPAKRQKKETILKALSSINFMLGAVLRTFHAFYIWSSNVVLSKPMIICISFILFY